MILVVKTEGNRQVERPEQRSGDNIKINLREMGWGGMDSINLVQNRSQWRVLVNSVMNLLVP
jgi:hypothetical protein